MDPILTGQSGICVVVVLCCDLQLCCMWTAVWEEQYGWWGKEDAECEVIKRSGVVVLSVHTTFRSGWTIWKGGAGCEGDEADELFQ